MTGQLDCKDNRLPKFGVTNVVGLATRYMSSGARCRRLKHASGLLFLRRL
jgi:hypothetical protein